MCCYLSKIFPIQDIWTICKLWWGQWTIERFVVESTCQGPPANQIAMAIGHPLWRQGKIMPASMAVTQNCLCRCILFEDIWKYLDTRILQRSLQKPELSTSFVSYTWSWSFYRHKAILLSNQFSRNNLLDTKVKLLLLVQGFLKLEVGQMSAVSLPKTAWTTLTMIMLITMMMIALEWICLKIAKHLDLLFGLAGYLQSFKFTGHRNYCVYGKVMMI